MPLSQEQYNQIMLGYSRTRDLHHAEMRRRRDEVYTRIPEFRMLESRIPDLGMDTLRRQLGEAERGGAASDTGAAGKKSRVSADPWTLMSDTVREVTRKKQALLVQNGFPSDYLDPIYTCPDCHDTGYVEGQKCHCLRAKEVKVLYSQSHLEELMKTNNFSLMSERYYQGENLEHFRRARDTALQFVSEFGSSYRNLYFYGTVGTGKSFLSISIAQKLLEKGFSVIYFSAAGLFRRISQAMNESRTALSDFMKDITECDLLVIDDLGTEMTNTFTNAQLFSLINERHLRSRPTIINSNLSLEEMHNLYSDRIFSRIVSNYTICKLTGADIRILKTRG